MLVPWLSAFELLGWLDGTKKGMTLIQNGVFLLSLVIDQLTNFFMRYGKKDRPEASGLHELLSCKEKFFGWRKERGRTELFCKGRPVLPLAIASLL